MSSDLYLKSLKDRLKALDKNKAERQFNIWTYNYTVHSKAIHQYSPEIYVLLLKYSIHYLYILSKVHSELNQKIQKFFSENDLNNEKAKKTSENFNPDKYCIFEDFTNFIEKAFEAVEGEYKEKILNIKEFSNYCQIISVFKLICDLIDLVEIWREKDEGLQKFQKLCKYRVIQIIKAKTEYENSPEGKEYEKEMKQLNEQIKKEKIMEEKKRKEEEEKAKKSQLLKSYTMKKAVVNKFNPYKDIMIDNKNQINNKAKDNYYGLSNPFADINNNPFNLPPPSKNKSMLIAKLPKRKVIYSEKDKEAQEINKMYNNYDPGEYQKSPDENNYYNIYDKPDIKINKNNIDEIMNLLLKGYEYPGSKEINISEIPVLFKSLDYYKLRLHIKSILIPKIISLLNKNNAEEAHQYSKMLLYYLSIINPK